MKSSIIAFTISIILLLSVAILIFSSGTAQGTTDILQKIIILILAGFGIFAGFRRLGSKTRMEPAEDELSKKVMRKASSLSFFISIYIWVAMLYLKNKFALDSDQVIGSGIIAMSLTLFICWIIFHFRGVGNE